MFQIFVVSNVLSESTTTLDVNKNDTILRVKQKISDKQAIPVSIQRLHFRRKVLANQKDSLESLCINPNSTLYLSIPHTHRRRLPSTFSKSDSLQTNSTDATESKQSKPIAAIAAIATVAHTTTLDTIDTSLAHDRRTSSCSGGSELTCTHDRKEVMIRLRHHGEYLPCTLALSSFGTFDSLLIKLADVLGQPLKCGAEAKVFYLDRDHTGPSLNQSKQPILLTSDADVCKFRLYAVNCHFPCLHIIESPSLQCVALASDNAKFRNRLQLKLSDLYPCTNSCLFECEFSIDSANFRLASKRPLTCQIDPDLENMLFVDFPVVSGDPWISDCLHNKHLHARIRRKDHLNRYLHAGGDVSCDTRALAELHWSGMKSNRTFPVAASVQQVLPNVTDLSEHFIDSWVCPKSGNINNCQISDEISDKIVRQQWQGTKVTKHANVALDRKYVQQRKILDGIKLQLKMCDNEEDCKQQNNISVYESDCKAATCTVVTNGKNENKNGLESGSESGLDGLDALGLDKDANECDKLECLHGVVTREVRVLESEAKQCRKVFKQTFDSLTDGIRSQQNQLLKLQLEVSRKYVELCKKKSDYERTQGRIFSKHLNVLDANYYQRQCLMFEFMELKQKIEDAMEKNKKEKEETEKEFSFFEEQWKSWDERCVFEWIKRVLNDRYGSKSTLFDIKNVRKNLLGSGMCGKYLKVWDLTDCMKLGIDNVEVETYLYEKVMELTKDEGKAQRLCVICYVNTSAVVLTPCGHVCYCKSCSSDDRLNTTQCPVCRAEVEKVFDVFF